MRVIEGRGGGVERVVQEGAGMILNRRQARKRVQLLEGEYLYTATSCIVSGGDIETIRKRASATF